MHTERTPNVNCLSYALAALGILDPEEYVGPVEQYYAVRRLFTYADRLTLPDVVVLETSGEVPTLWHIAVVEKVKFCSSEKYLECIRRKKYYQK